MLPEGMSVVGALPNRVGVFGGTFDPVHIGHLVVAEEAAASQRLDIVLFVPAGDPPHKPGAPITAADHRVRMLELAVATCPHFKVSRIDVDRPGPHYTVDMLRVVAAAWPGAALFAILGCDSLNDLPTWRAPRQILAAATMLVAGRPGVECDLSDLTAALPGIGDRTVFLDAPLIGVSATDVRHRVAGGRPIRHQVPAAVEAYIRRHGLYVS